MGMLNTMDEGVSSYRRVVQDGIRLGDEPAASGWATSRRTLQSLLSRWTLALELNLDFFELTFTHLQVASRRLVCEATLLVRRALAACRWGEVQRAAEECRRRGVASAELRDVEERLR